MFRSSRILFLTYLGVPMALGMMILAFSIMELLKSNIDGGILGLTIPILFLILFLKIKQFLVEVELHDSLVKVISGKEMFEIQWIDVESVNFTGFGIYRIKTKDDLFYFTPADYPIHIFTIIIYESDMDEFIAKKKKQYDI